MAKNKPKQTLQPRDQVHLVEQTVEYQSGPIPAPQELEAYNKVFTGAAERIFRMAETQSEHRMSLENHVVHTQQSQMKRGQYFGLFAVLFIGSCATYAAISGAEKFASILGGSTVLGLASAFLGGKYIQKKDLAEKAKANPERRVE